MIIRRIALVVLAAAMVPAHSLAQGTFPAPLLGQGAAPKDGSAPMASLGGPTIVPLGRVPMQGTPTSSETQAACLKGFNLLREDADKKGQLIKEASDRHASPVEACKIIASYGVAEAKMIKYLEANATACEVPARITDELRNGHKNTGALEKKVCTVAEQMKKPRGVISDFGDPAYGRIRLGF